MSVPVNLPKLAMAMAEGTLAEWLVPDGASVEKDQAIYTLETDKSSLEIEAPASGTLRIRAVAGELYPVGTLVAEIE